MPVKRLIKAREEPIEMLLAELDYCLYQAGEELPSLEAKFSDLQQVFRAANAILNQIETRLIPKR